MYACMHISLSLSLCVFRFRRIGRLAHTRACVLLCRAHASDDGGARDHPLTLSHTVTLSYCLSLSPPLCVCLCHSGAWKSLSFKRYNLDAKGVPPVSGHLHPLLKVREEFRKIFFEMGYGPRYRDTHTHTHTHTGMWTDIERQTERERGRCTHTHTHAGIWTDIEKQTETRTRTRTQIHAEAYAHRDAVADAHRATCIGRATNTHGGSPSVYMEIRVQGSLTHSLAHSLTHSLCHWTQLCGNADQQFCGELFLELRHAFSASATSVT
jgi:hypothetical protein